MKALAAAFLALALAASPPGELGVPFLVNYSPKDYGGPSQNWAFAEDAHGILYVGNNAGVLEFDGATWRMIPTRNRTCVRSLGVDRAGRIFVGAKNEFGYLEPDSAGKLRFVPLEGLVEPRAREFSDVWAVLPVADGVYFTTRNYIFRYDGASVRTWKAGTSLTLAWKVRGRIYAYERGVGPVTLGPAGLQPLPGAEAFRQELVNFMVPWGTGNAILAGTAHKGLFVFDGDGFQPFPTEADAYFRTTVITHGVLTDNGCLAVGGLYGGCFVLDREGRLLMHLDRASGLQEELVNRLYVDARSRIWLGLNRGITQVEWPSPFTTYSEHSGIDGNVGALCRHGGNLYAGTSKGIFQLERKPLPRPPQGGAARSLDPDSGPDRPAFGPLWRFRKLEGFTTQVWNFAEVDGRLLAACSKGVYEVAGGKVRPFAPWSDKFRALCLLASRARPGRLYVGHLLGVESLRKVGSRWVDEGPVQGLACEARTLAEDADGALWVGSQSSGAFRVRWPGPEGQGGPEVEAYGTAQGLPSLAHDFVRGFASGLLFTTHDGFYRFLPETRRFVPDPRFRALRAEGAWYPDGVTEGPGGRIWMHILNEATGERRTGQAVPGPDGSYRFAGATWSRVAGSALYAILPEASGIVWMGGPDGLFRYDPGMDAQRPWSLPPVIRRVTGPGGSVLFGGVGAWRGAQELPYASGTLRFEFAAPGGVPDAATRYQVRLEGWEKAWSPWTPETFRDYTNLPEGSYRFQVRARDGSGQVSEAGSAAFRVRPPFYRAWWAYLLYLGAAAVVGDLAVQWRMRKGELDRRRLVRKVAERTEQLRRRTLQLEKAKSVAEAATRAKSEFLANMSHEIRTPLNTILGYSEILKDEVADPRHREHLAAIASGGKALLGIIGDILDLSRIEAGRMELEYAPVSLADLVQEVDRTFALRCREKGLEFRLLADAALPPILVLPGIHLRQILFNLVGNAVKFTERGFVSVTFRQTGRVEGSVAMAVEVEDTGIGIPEGHLETIFESFRQVAGQDASRYGGAGLGLAICRRLAGMMGGTLRVASSEGLGSTFTLDLQGIAVAREAAGSDAEPGFQEAFLPATLLLVDDAQPNRDLLKHFFHACPFTYLEASGGTEALEAARKTRPDLVIMDLRMPGMDGAEATRRLKADPVLRDVPVIVLTASTTPGDDAPAWAAGADGFLRKPVSRARLAAELARFLPHRPLPEPGPEPAAEPGPAPGARTALPGLLEILERECLEEWERQKDVFFLDRMAAFAARIRDLADAHQQPGLKAWADRVADQARAFDMERLPGTFRAFPQILEGLRRQVADVPE